MGVMCWPALSARKTCASRAIRPRSVTTQYSDTLSSDYKVRDLRLLCDCYKCN